MKKELKQDGSENNISPVNMMKMISRKLPAKNKKPRLKPSDAAKVIARRRLMTRRINKLNSNVKKKALKI